MKLSEDAVLNIAKCCHDINNQYCLAIGDPTTEWDDNIDVQYNSVRGVLYFLDNSEATPEKQHQEWLKSKEADGWTYGLEKNQELKTHPCMVPYIKLPQSQRVKDYLFQQTIRNCLFIMGLY